MNAVSGLKRSHISQTDKETLLSIVNEEAERLNHLVAELLRFARPVAASRGPASLLDLCEKVRDEAPEGVTVRVLKDEGRTLNPVLVDPGLFRLALDNLMANAVQAMGEGGVIELCVHQGRFLDGSEAAALDVRDTGCGMTAAERESAMKPFFTTKPRGTGLGIPIVLRIVEAHGGELSIDSQRGVGTTVSIKLPFDSPTQGPASYPGSKNPSTRRRMRTFSSLAVGGDGDQKKVTSESK
jgi:signal transduction histidine kinase